VAKRSIVKRGGRTIVLLTVALSAILLGTGSASASTNSGSSKSAVVTQAEKTAHPVGGTTITPALACPAYYVCAWAPNGEETLAYFCNDDVPLDNSYYGYGAWVNNQTPGTRAKFKDRNHHVIYTTPGAYSANYFYLWDPVWYIDAC
jgi:hypothetical protein